mgnify:CR=1 FL=1|jgi:hypothetical protein|tara:strand:+ start:2856 stop:3071 length:216 start_codon:yes stop_codon:yes gene_type:complete
MTTRFDTKKVKINDEFYSSHPTLAILKGLAASGAEVEIIEVIGELDDDRHFIKLVMFGIEFMVEISINDFV